MTHLATALLTAVIVFTPGHAFAQATAAPASPDQIIALERARQEAFVRGDVDFLDRQTSEDYTT
jgi:hypothetical protein